MEYKLGNDFTLRKTDKALFDFSKAQLIQFNDYGFEILLQALNNDIIDSQKEKNFLKRLIDEGYLREC